MFCKIIIDDDAGNQLLLKSSFIQFIVTIFIKARLGFLECSEAGKIKSPD